MLAFLDACVSVFLHCGFSFGQAMSDDPLDFIDDPPKPDAKHRNKLAAARLCKRSISKALNSTETTEGSGKTTRTTTHELDAT